jgi:hypothetical protein
VLSGQLGEGPIESAFTRFLEVALGGAIARLTLLLTQVCRDVSEFLHGSAAALVLRRHPPSLESAEVSLKAYDAEVNALRAEGLTRRLSTDEVERLFALGFMLEQIHRNLGDLARCVHEWAGPLGVRERTKY